MKTNEWVLALNVSSLITHWRTVRGLTQEQLAKQLGMRQEQVARLEQMKYLPTMRSLIRIAEALDKELEVRFR